MKIAVFLPSLSGGGAEKVALTLCKGFGGAGHDVDLVLMNKTGALVSKIPNDLRVIDLNRPRLWTSAPAFARYLRRVRPDVILSLMPLANGIAILANLLSRQRVKVVISEHNSRDLTLMKKAPNTRYAVLRSLIRYSYRYSSAIVAVSHGVAEQIRQMPGTDDVPIYAIYNPLTTEAPKAQVRISSQQISVKDRKETILGAGRLVEQKDFATLLRAFATLRTRRDCWLVILGEGHQETMLKNLAAKLGVREFVRFPGFVDNPAAWMSQASVFVLSSQHEGLPSVLVEAMSCGTPVVSTDCLHGPREVLADGKYGRLVPVGDADALAKAIEDTLDEPMPSCELQSRADFFDSRAAVRAYLDVFESVLD